MECSYRLFLVNRELRSGNGIHRELELVLVILCRLGKLLWHFVEWLLNVYWRQRNRRIQWRKLWDLRFFWLSYQLTMNLEVSTQQNPIHEAYKNGSRANIGGLLVGGGDSEFLCGLFLLIFHQLIKHNKFWGTKETVLNVLPRQFLTGRW